MKIIASNECGDAAGTIIKTDVKENIDDIFPVVFSKAISNSNISSKKIAEKINVSPPQIVKWLSGETLPSLKKFVLLASILNVDVYEVLGLERRTVKNASSIITWKLVKINSQHTRLEWHCRFCNYLNIAYEVNNIDDIKNSNDCNLICDNCYALHKEIFYTNKSK